MTHPQNARDGSQFMNAQNMSFPGGAQGIQSATPPSSENGKPVMPNGQGNAQQQPANGVATPAQTPGSAPQGVSGIVPTLQNIVATVNLDCRLDLKTIALHARNAEYSKCSAGVPKTSETRR